MPARDEDTQSWSTGWASFDEEGVPVGANTPPLSQQPLEIRLAP